MTLGKLRLKIGNRKIKHNIELFLFFAVLFCLLVFRSIDIGVDNKNYQYVFKQTSDMKWSETIKGDVFEPLYQLLNKTVSAFTSNYRWVIVCVSLLSLIPIYLLYREDEYSSTLKILIFINMSVFPMLFSGLRQCIAMGIGTLAYIFVRKRKLLLFLVMVLLALMFHRSGFILLALYPVYHMKIKKKHLAFVIPALILTFVFNKSIFTFLSLFISDIFGEIKVTSTGAYSSLILFVLFLIFSFVIPDENALDEETIGLRNILLLAVIIQMFAPLHFLAMRMNYYFIVFIPMLIPKILKCSRQNMQDVAKLANAVMCVFFTLYFFYSAYFGADILKIFPYRFM